MESGERAAHYDIRARGFARFELTVAIDLNRGLMGWGVSLYGQLGLPYIPTSPCISNPGECVAPPNTMPPLYQISATWDHALAFSPGYANPAYPYDTHGLLSWGHNAVAGGHFVALLRTDGEVITWGTFEYSLGNNNGYDGPGGVYGPNYRGGGDPVLYPINNPPTSSLPPTIYKPPYYHIATTHQSVMGLIGLPRPTNENPAIPLGTLHIWGQDSSGVRTFQPGPTVLFSDVVGGSYADWAVGVRLDTGAYESWGDGGSHFPAAGVPASSLEFQPGNSNFQVCALCYDPNCDGSTVPPVLNADDFQCFANAYAATQSLPYVQQVTSYANCDGSTAAPVLNANDWLCFNNRFAAGGCP